MIFCIVATRYRYYFQVKAIKAIADSGMKRCLLYNPDKLTLSPGSVLRMRIRMQELYFSSKIYLFMTTKSNQDPDPHGSAFWLPASGSESLSR